MAVGPDVGLTVIDFIAPAFIFAIGLTFPGSVRRRLARDGGRRTIEHTAVRALALIGLGGGGMPWGTLQSIGAAIIIALPTLFLPVPARLAMAVAGLGVYQWLLDSFWLAEVVAASNAGLQGSIAWGRNPLVLYVAHLILLAVFLVPAAPWWHGEASSPRCTRLPRGCSGGT